MSDIQPPELPEPANLRFLRRLVTTLTAVMIVGLITVVTLLVIRLQAPTVTVPDALVLPDGASPLAVTRTPSLWIVTTTDGRVFAFAPDGTDLREIAMD
ncbi:DUF6476 family protein [Jannaschia aquimarina]|uniref:DUF6476 family protein n=1 Tax=Jannaschia aquimarina TaxID=935700 RepID=UPI000698CA1C|nr:DUF6476 family protein [Jannaschia aquimarina]